MDRLSKLRARKVKQKKRRNDRKDHGTYYLINNHFIGKKSNSILYQTLALYLFLLNQYTSIECSKSISVNHSRHWMIFIPT